jgi:riboflavin biosynthesis pyrimidine reductase
VSGLLEQLTAQVPLFARPAAEDLPAIAVNMVTSVDGATTLGGKVDRLTGPADQLLLRQLRDDARERRQRARGSAEPLLCVVSRDANLGPGAPALRAAPSALIFLTSEGAQLPDAEREVLAIRAPTAAPGEQVTLRPLLARLRADHGVEHVICEGGGTLNAALLAEGVVGELFVAVSPMVARERDSPPLVGGVEGPVDLALLAHAAADDFVFLRYGLRS